MVEDTGRAVADVLAENQRMLRRLRTRTSIVGSSTSHGVVTLRFARRPGDEAESPRAGKRAPALSA